jgi:putative inorganic carbon (hco3(-)) transporter
MSVAQNSDNLPYPEKISFTFLVFLLWTFVLLSRPQDIFTALVPLRPAFVASLFAAFCFLLKSMTSGFHSDSSFSRSRQTTLYVALILWMMIGAPFAIYWKYAFSFLFYDYIKIVLFYFVFINMVDTVKKLEIATKVCCFGVGFYAIMVLMHGEFIGGRLSFERKAFDPNDLAFFTLSFLPFNFLFVSSETPVYHRLISIVSIIASVLVILMSGSRGGFLAFLVVIILIVKRTYTIKIWYKILAAVLILIVLSFNVLTIDTSRYKTIANMQGDYNFTAEGGRITVWKRGISYMLANPLFGVGVDCFPLALGDERAREGLRPRWQTAHNSFLLVGAETGIIGFVLFALMNLNAFKTFSKAGKDSISENLRKIGEMAKIGFAGHFVCIIFLSQSYSFYWAFYIAFSSAIDRFIQTESFRVSPILYREHVR